MRDLSSLLLAASMDQCLAAIAEFHDADDLSPQEAALRLAQFAACAEGRGCPEVAFDPTALRLRAVDLALRDRRHEREAWRGRVRRAIEAALSRRVLTRAA